MDFYKNKTVWITGASSGIGKELAVQLASKGANLVLSARSEDKLQALKSELTAKGIRVWIVPLDLEKNEYFNQLVADVFNKTNKIDVLINNGGISQRSLAFETDMVVDRRIMEINYFGTIALTKAVLPKMKQQGEGYISVTSSLTGIFGFPMRSAYAASKHALHGYFETLQLEETKNNIFTTIVCPARIATDISKSALQKSGEQWGKADEGQEKGMPVDQCAKQYLKAIARQKKKIVIGSFGEKFLTKCHAWMPPLFYKIASNISPT